MLFCKAIFSEPIHDIVFNKDTVAPVVQIKGTISRTKPCNAASMSLVKTEYRISEMPVFIPTMYVLFHWKRMLEMVLLAQTDGHNAFYSHLGRTVLKHEFKQLVAKPKILHIRKDGDRQQLNDGSVFLVQRGNISDNGGLEHFGSSDSLRVDRSDHTASHVHNTLTGRKSVDTRFQLLRRSPQRPRPASGFKFNQLRDIRHYGMPDPV